MCICGFESIVVVDTERKLKKVIFAGGGGGLWRGESWREIETSYFDNRPRAIPHGNILSAYPICISWHTKLE